MAPDDPVARHARPRAARRFRWSEWRWADLSLEYKLPLLMAVQLAIILGASLIIKYVALTRAAEVSVSERFTNAVRRIAATAELALADRHARAFAVAVNPAVRAVLREAEPNAEVLSQARAALAPLAAASAPRLPVELLRADGSRALLLGAEAAVRPAPLPDRDSTGATPLFLDFDRAVAWTLVRVQENGRTLGYIAALMRVGGPPDAPQMLSELTGEAVTLHLRNADGQVWIAAPHAVLVPPPVRRFEERNFLSYVRADIGRTVAAEAAIGDSPWLMVLETPARLVRAQARDTVFVLALATAMLMLFGLLLWSWLSRRLTRPLTEVSIAADAITRGDYSRRVHAVGEDELGRLARSFNHMAAEVELSRRELLRRVQESQEAREEADRLRVQAEQAREEAERANRAKSDFLAVMSHELRTPLNAIAGYAQLIELGIHGPVSEPQRDALMRIGRNQRHLLSLINDVLSYSKLDAGKVEYHVSDIAIDDVLRELDLLIGPQVRANDVEFIMRTDSSLMVRADRDKLQQVLLNLLGNALKFTPAGGSITVAARAQGRQVDIVVSDTGIGIPEDRLDAIFDPFFQVDRALNRPGEGVGLGLAISRELTRGMGGELSVTSEHGAGSAFTVTLPIGARALQPA